MKTDDKPIYVIENWGIYYHQGSSGTYYRLEGHIKGRSPEILEIEPAHTSKLISIDFENNTAETLNSFYQLGKCRDVVREPFKEFDECECHYDSVGACGCMKDKSITIKK